jgi:hypothetical protein
LVDAIVQRTQVSKVDIERSLLPGLWIFVEKVGHSQFDGVIGRAVDWGRKQGWEWCYRHFWYIIVLTKSVEKCVLKLC